MPLSFQKFLLFGDSIIEYSNDQAGFALAPALQNLYTRKLDVVTRGFSGYNSDHALVVLREILKADHASSGNIRLMSIFFGTNDAASTFQGVPVERYKSNLRQLVKMASDYNIKVILIGPGLHDQNLCSIARGDEGEQEPFSSSRATRTYGDAAKEVARETKVPFIDLWRVFQDYGSWSTEDLLDGNVDLGELLSDGIHFTPRAYELFYDEIVETIVAQYPELAPAKLPLKFPSYTEIDYSHIDESIMEYLNK